MPTHVYLPIKDLQGCRDALLVPIELTPESQAELASRCDPRIMEQLMRYYVVINAGVKRVKPRLLKTEPTR